jgi:hypothetical protein
VNHLELALTTILLLSILSGGVGTGEFEVLATDTLRVLSAITLPEDEGEFLAVLKFEGIGDDLIVGNDVLMGLVSFKSLNFLRAGEN